MNNKIPDETRIAFREWLRKQLKKLEFYQRRGDHFLIREFHKYCLEKGQDIDEASLGRYLREDDPVLPTPERCRMLAVVLELPAVVVLLAAGYLIADDIAYIRSLSVSSGEKAATPSQQ